MGRKRRGGLTSLADDLADQLKAKRGNLTQAQAATLIGVPKRTYQSWEGGHRVPRNQHRAQVDKWLGRG